MFVKEMKRSFMCTARMIDHCFMIAVTLSVSLPISSSIQGKIARDCPLTMQRAPESSLDTLNVRFHLSYRIEVKKSDSVRRADEFIVVFMQTSDV